MSKGSQTLNNKDQKSKKPSERTARLILEVLSWFKDIFNPPNTNIPQGLVLQHRGHFLPAGKELKYPQILLVEDNPQTAQDFIGAIRSYYIYGSVKIFTAHAYNAAVTFFDTEDINLVIMDAELEDIDGDGAALTRHFIDERPDITILANSSSRISNLKLTGFGARGTLWKSTIKLNSWLLKNDPAGANG